MTASQFEALSVVSDALARARFGRTATGDPARILTETEHRTAMKAILALLKEDAGEKDEYPAISWRVDRSGFSQWHRQRVPNLTQCGTPVPQSAIVAHGIATSVRPVDGCRKCWADEPAGVGSVA